VLFSWRKKKSRPEGRPEFREETPNEAYAASLLHCTNAEGDVLVPP
jgi:hypothetical protein